MASGVGETLREARERRGVAIEDASASTKIQPRLLRAIEAEDWAALPGEFYASRFIHTYAQYLGLGGGELVDEYERGRAPGRGGREPGRRGSLAAPDGREPSRRAGREPRVEPKPLGRATGVRRNRRPGSRRGGTGAARVSGGLGPGSRPGGGGTSPRAVGAAVILAAIVAGFIIVMTGSGGGSSGHDGRGGAATTPAGGGQSATGTAQSGAGGKTQANGAGGAGNGAGGEGGAKAGGQPSQAENAKLTLTTTAEVWVCLLNAQGNPLIDGQILPVGASEGPYRSAAFTLALGNGAVEIEVDGKPAKLAPSSDPVGFQIGRRGGLTELAEGERPTCA